MAKSCRNHIILNHYRGGAREECLVPLNFSGEVAKGFLEPTTREVLKSNFDEEDYETLERQLYPQMENMIRLDSFRKV